MAVKKEETSFWLHFAPTGTFEYLSSNFGSFAAPLPRKDNPCEWGSAYWRAAGGFLSHPWLLRRAELDATAASEKEATVAVLVLQSVNKVMALTSFEFAMLQRKPYADLSQTQRAKEVCINS